MEKEGLKKRVLDVIKSGKNAFIFSTVDENNCPQSRFMGAFMLEREFTIYLETSSSSRKMKQIKNNSGAQLVFFRPDYSEVAIVSGRAAIEESLEKKKEIWAHVPSCKDYYPAYDAPEFGVIRFETKKIEYLNPKMQLAPFKITI